MVSTNYICWVKKKKRPHSFFFPNNTNTSPKDIHTRGNWNLSCCKNNWDLKTRQSIRNRNDHRDGLNANEKLFIKSFRWNALWSFKGLTSFLRTFETTSASGHHRFSITQKPWPDKSMAEGHPRFQCHRCSLRALIGWYMSGLLKSGPVFLLHNQWLVLCRDVQKKKNPSNQTTNTVPEIFRMAASFPSPSV